MTRLCKGCEQIYNDWKLEDSYKEYQKKKHNYLLEHGREC